MWARGIRIAGLIRIANHVRDTLSHPLTPAERDALVERLRESLDAVDRILTGHGAGPHHLPGPSRRAYRFLKQIDPAKISVGGAPDQSAPGATGRINPESVTFRGLCAFLDQVLDDAARTMHAGRFNAEATLRVIRNTRHRLDAHMEHKGLQPEHLTPGPRELLGWFRYFAADQPFRAYLDALQRGCRAFTALSPPPPGWRPPLLVHFRPSSHLYRWKQVNQGTRIVLPTPAISFDDPLLHYLGLVMTGDRRGWPAVTDAMLAEPYQTVAAQLEAAAGVVERTHGLAYDLADVFERVNRRYFAGQMPRPKLTWNRTLTGTKFGHYEFVADTVMISTSLDRAEVPAFVIEHVMHHELLHKKHGMTWQGWRRHSHTPAFRAEEQTFERYPEAACFLNRFAGRTG